MRNATSNTVPGYPKGNSEVVVFVTKAMESHSDAVLRILLGNTVPVVSESPSLIDTNGLT